MYLIKSLFFVVLALMLFLLPEGVGVSSPKAIDEICDNAIDDDNDGLVDINDPDCECPILAPISRIPNPSFEEQRCCPQNRSELGCSDTWIQASAPTTDYLHNCGWMGWEQFPPPLPFPDGRGAVGFRDGRVIQGVSEPNWKEYAGACLLAPLQAGVAYRFQFHIGFSDYRSSPSINITFFGNTDCKNLPFGGDNERLGCPTNDTTNWVRLGAVRASGANNWVKREIDVTPETDIYAIAIGPDCSEPMRSVSTYYFFDNLILDEQRVFDFQIQSNGHRCSNNFSLSVPNVAKTQYQWYKEGVALMGETRSTLEVKTGEGDYQVRVTSEAGCKITPAYQYRIPSYSTTINEYICQGEQFAFKERNLTQPGTYAATFQTVDNCDSLVELNLEVVEDQTISIEAKIFEGDHYQVGSNQIKAAGTHEVQLSSQLGCDSLVVLDLSYYNIYIPNVFSPNGDGINDYFNLYGEADLEVVKNLKIFSRWGELMYEATDIFPESLNAGWDGRMSGQVAPTGIYLYTAAVRMVDGQEKTYSGEVSLMR